MACYAHTMQEPNLTQERFQLFTADMENERDAFAQALREGLGGAQKSLACRYLYDDEGSRLFEAICELPEYYLTRSEREILDRRGGAIAQALLGRERRLEFVELGAGNSAKTHLLLEALHERAAALRFVPIDVNEDVLRRGGEALSDQLVRLQVRALAMDNERGLARLSAFDDGSRRVIAWLGSSAANMSRAATVAALKRFQPHLRAGDRLLLGIDLRKDPRKLELAYDDPAGVSAAFAKNLLVRVNAEFEADFDPAAFGYLAEYHVDDGYVAMYLTSLRQQRVRIAALDWEVDFAPGERLHTEDSYKYSLDEIGDLARAVGMEFSQYWLDAAAGYCVASLASS